MLKNKIKTENKLKKNMSIHVMGHQTKKHHTLKNCEAQFPTNQMLKDQIGKKNQLHKMI